VTPLSGDERRAVALLAALLLLASAARWLERPRSILDDAPTVDLASLEEASRAARDDPATSRPRRRRVPAAPAAPAPDGRGASGYTTATPIGPARAGTSESAAPIRLNAATAEELQRISGIGPAIAARLLARRDSLGAFRSYDDVDAVSGIGPALLARIQAATTLW
jgi:competence ComEA-like helix-hairpin-helix protein